MPALEPYYEIEYEPTVIEEEVEEIEEEVEELEPELPGVHDTYRTLKNVALEI